MLFCLSFACHKGSVLVSKNRQEFSCVSKVPGEIAKLVAYGESGFFQVCCDASFIRSMSWLVFNRSMICLFARI